MERLDSSTRARYEHRAKVFKALGHPTRLFIVEQLAKGELCVCELKKMIDADLSTISKHLSVLKNAGLVTDDKRGSNVYYHLRISPDGSLFACMDEAAAALASAFGGPDA